MTVFRAWARPDYQKNFEFPHRRCCSFDNVNDTWPAKLHAGPPDQLSQFKDISNKH